MSTNKEHINIVWFKRDLRLQDNEAIYNAINTNCPTLLLYVFENSLKEDKHYSERHWNFIKQSLQDLNNQLLVYNTKVLCVSSEVIHAIGTLQQFWKIDHVFSHQETGIRLTYERDKAFSRFCKNNLIDWKENTNNGIHRGLKNRENWRDDCEHYMNQQPFEFDPKPTSFIAIEKILELEKVFNVVDLDTSLDYNFQQGGTTKGYEYLTSFFKGRYKNYSFHISKPELARRGCSRLSPYIAWGNLSIRQIWQYAVHQRDY